MSRKEKFSRANQKKRKKQEQIEAANASKEEQSQLPARKKKYPSSKHQLTKLFYNTLIILFIALVAVLIWYGNEYSD